MPPFVDEHTLHTQLELETPVLCPNQSLLGVLHLHVLKEVRVGTIELTLAGVERCLHYSHANPYARQVLTAHDFMHLHQRIQLYDGGQNLPRQGAEATHLMSGATHRFPFCIMIPSDVPPSVAVAVYSSDCAISYTLSIRVVIPQGIDATLERELCVKSIAPLTQWLGSLSKPLSITPTSSVVVEPSTRGLRGVFSRTLSFFRQTSERGGLVECSIDLLPFILPLDHVYTTQEQALWLASFVASGPNARSEDTSSLHSADRPLPSMQHLTDSKSVGGKKKLARRKDSQYWSPSDRSSLSMPLAVTAVAKAASATPSPLPTVRGDTLTLRLHLRNLTAPVPIATVRVRLLQRAEIFSTEASLSQYTEVASGQRLLPGGGLPRGEELDVVISLQLTVPPLPFGTAVERPPSPVLLPTFTSKYMKVETVLEVSFPDSAGVSTVREPGLCYIVSAIDMEDRGKTVPQEFVTMVEPPKEYQLGPALASHGTQPIL